MTRGFILTAIALLFSAPAWSQAQARDLPSPDRQPAIPSAPGAKRSAPSNPGFDSGMVIVPPDTDSKSIRIPPNVDPEITKPTEEIDRKNRQKSQDMKKPPESKAGDREHRSTQSPRRPQ